MRYEDVVRAFFAPRPPGTTIPAVVAEPTPARRLRDAAEPLAMHATWARATNKRLEDYGLDFLGAYVWGRATCLGMAGAPVVVAAFAWFEPALITTVLDQARAAVGLEDLMAARNQATIASLEEVLAAEDPKEIDRVAGALLTAAANGNPAGRPLFAGLQALEVPSSPAGRLWRGCELVREHRGDSHTAAVLAAGLDPVEANLLTERWMGMELGSYTATRGWSPEIMAAAADGLRGRRLLHGDQLTDEAAVLRSNIEFSTDRQQAPIVAALGSQLDSVCRSLTRLSQRCIDAGAFPADELKRAAG